mmetsp:Transcript_18837/g.42093  ORF Transcript_18837/g.42093 Transcript_18837/m.42093 type:complete len:209 (-) Transcript_18837:775-1401(-)
MRSATARQRSAQTRSTLPVRTAPPTATPPVTAPVTAPPRSLIRMGRCRARFRALVMRRILLVTGKAGAGTRPLPATPQAPPARSTRRRPPRDTGLQGTARQTTGTATGTTAISAAEGAARARGLAAGPFSAATRRRFICEACAFARNHEQGGSGSGRRPLLGRPSRAVTPHEIPPPPVGYPPHAGMAFPQHLPGRLLHRRCWRHRVAD